MNMNYLIINALKINGRFYGDDFKVECPKGSGNYLALNDVANEITARLLHNFEKDDQNKRRIHGNYNWFYQKEENRDLVLFNEYFHGDTLRGLGASHQTGWTALIVNLLFDMKS